MEIKEQTQVFITVPYYFRMQVQKEAADIKADISLHDRNRADNVSQ